MHHWLRLAATMASACVLHACTSAKVQVPVDWRQHHQQLAAISKWELRGRVSIKSGDETVLASINWSQDGDNLVIRLFGTLGLGSHELHSDQHGAKLLDSSGKVHHAASIQELMQQKLGWSTPPMFGHWVRGLPGPGELGHDQATFDPQGRLRTLTQAQWHIEYLDYTTSGGMALPAKIRMRHDTAAVMVIAIHNWKIQHDLT